MIDKTLKACVDICQGLLNDYHRDIEVALDRIPEDENEALAISMGFKIKSMDSLTNKVTGTISFAKEKIKGSATEIVKEKQLELTFTEDGKTAAAGG